MGALTPDKAASRLLAAYDTGGQVAPLSESAQLSPDAAYAIAQDIAARRVARGERVLGYKIGFTNRSIWDLYNVDGPMWAPMYDSTVAPLPEGGAVTLPQLAEPRIEPEIAFAFRATPKPEMTLADLAGTIDWMAHGFEIVTSPYPNWRFQLADCIAAQSLHGCFWYGPRQPLPDDLGVLERFAMELEGPRGTVQGHARDVLDGPLHALGHLVRGLAQQGQALAPGMVVTTGTLTDAGPVAPGETWRTRFTGIDLPGLQISFAT